jgi:hypothetical protein
MKIAVWDTYVTRKNGKIMHFDILVEEKKHDTRQVFDFGKSYLAQINEEGQKLDVEECKFCHIESAEEELKIKILKDGFVILELENCKE